MCRIWSFAGGRVLLGTLVCKALRQTLFKAGRIGLVATKIPRCDEDAEQTCDFIHKFEGTVSLSLVFRDQLGPVVEPLRSMHSVFGLITTLDLR
jgi:hypothetical protein